MPSGILMHPAVWPQYMGEKVGSAVPPLGGVGELGAADVGRKFAGSPFWSRGLGPHLTQCGLGRGLYLPIKWHLVPSSRLATTDMGQKLGAVPFGEGKLCPHLTQCGQGRVLPACQVSS